MPSELNGFKYVMLPYNDLETFEPKLGFVCKRTYRVTHGEKASLDPAQLELNSGDVHWEQAQPLLSSIKFETDFVPCKPKTDVVVNARAYAPGGQPTDQMTVAVEVEGVTRKEILVIGDRFCLHRPGSSPQISRPQPFEQIPIRYEYAYGGFDPEASPDGGIPYPKNTVGIGFALGGSNAAPSVDRMPLPNLEDPKDRLVPNRIILPPERLADGPEPAGFGWYGKGWLPRALKAGLPEGQRELWAAAHDLEEIQKKGGQIRPFDLEYFNGASPGLIVPYLRGDEWMRLTGLTPDGDLRFRLPKHGVDVQIDLGQGLQKIEMFLTTVCVLAEDGRLFLCWSGNMPIRGMKELFEDGLHKIVVEPTLV